MDEIRFKSDKELAKMLGIKSYDSQKLSMEYIFANVSPTLQTKLKAAIEFYKRIINRTDVQVIDGAEDVIAIMRPLLMDLNREEVWALMLNSANRVLAKVKISEGGINGSLIDVNGIARHALSSNASAVVLVHNHPSGNAFPSDSDMEQTKRLKNALLLIDVRLLDHVIVAHGGLAYSFAEEAIYKK